MDLDDTICYCFHVPKRKIVNFIGITRPRRASQVSECGGAGTAKAVLHDIMKRYKGMVIVVDEEKKRITLMTQPVAETKGLKPFPVSD